MKSASFESLPSSPTVDTVGIAERAKRFQSRSIKTECKREGLDRVLSMIDLTTLEGADTPAKVRHLCYKAEHLHDAIPDLPSTAAVCVYPPFVKVARKALGTRSPVKIASVATYFPSGHATRKQKLEETRYAVSEGADEVDMVISRGRFLSGDHAFVHDEIAAVKEACGKARLKVILETGELGSLDAVRRASDIAMDAGADFIKTSTGKIASAATIPVTLVMLLAIRDFHFRTGQMVGMKPAGGISKSKLALHYLVAVKETLGEEWLDPHWFRFGASSLANDVLMQIGKIYDEGRYQTTLDYSKD